MDNMLFADAQVIYDLKLNGSRKNVLSRLKLRLVNYIFNRIKIKNPIITAKIGDFLLNIPFSHELPFIIKRSPYYSTNLSRIAKLVHEKYTDLKFIDIGANVGDSVALLRTKATYPILCIEGDHYFYSILQSNAAKFPDVHLVKVYVGETTEKINVVSMELGGTAHLVQSETETVPIKDLSAILGDYKLFRQSKMLKIDTDGFDNKIIRGATDFLRTSKPIIFFEYDPFFLMQQNEDGISIFKVLFNCGYRKMLIYENYGEFLLSADTDNKTLLEDITHFYTGRQGLLYCDICAFHEEDNDLFNTVRSSEMKFFSRPSN